MDNITQEDIGPQTEGELTSPLSPKRPRTDCAMTNNNNGKSRFDSHLLFIFPKTIGSPSSTSILQKDAGNIYTAECGDIKPPQDTNLIFTPITELTTSCADAAHTGSSKACSTAAERCLLPPVKDELPPVPETDKLSPYAIDDAGGALADSHTSEDTSADTSSHPDCKRLWKSLEAKPPGGCNLPGGNNKEGRQVLNSVSQIQAFTLSSSDEEGKCQPDCTCENMPHDTGFCNTWSRSAGVEESNQKKEYGFRENILFSKEKEEGNCPISLGDYANSKSIFLNPEKESSGNLTEGVKNEKILELQICENENFAACEGGTKGQVNENGMSKHSIPSAAECAEGSAISNDVVLAKNVATENVSLEADDFCGAKGELAAGKMIVKTQSEMADHTTETPVSARITQEPAEGDNDAGPFSVIEPAIWSETVREVREKHCNSERTVGVELSPSVKISKMETWFPLCFDMRPSHNTSDQSTQFAHQSRTQQWINEKNNICQSHTEPRACSVTTNKTCNKTGIEDSYHWKSSPSSSPTNPRPAGDVRQESHDTVGHQLKEQKESSCFPVSPNHLKTQEVEHLQTEITRMNREPKIKVKEITSFEVEIRTDKYGESENSEEKSNGSDWTEGNKLTHIHEELGNNLECMSDHPYSAAIPTMEKERKEETSVGEETDVQCNVEILVTSEDRHQQQSQQKGDMTEASPDEYVSVNKRLAPVSQHEQGDELCCFSDLRHRAETFMGESKEDHITLTFPPTSDAVVPGPHELIRSENSDNSPPVLNGSDRFSPVPSAFNFCACMPRGFDTFEKIQLPLRDDDGDDAGLSHSPLLPRLPGQLLKLPQQQLYHSTPEAKSSEHREVPEEEEEESRTENMANGFLSSDYSCNELPNFISAADVALEWPEQPDFALACNSSVRFHNNLNSQSVSPIVSSKSDSPASEVNDGPKFEMKREFDMVLKELNLFFEISGNDSTNNQTASSPEHCRDVAEASEADASDCQQHPSVPEVGCHRDASDNPGEDHSLDMCGGDAVVSCVSGSGDSEQEVPPGSHLCQETSMYTSEIKREPPEKEQQRKAWFPSFVCRPFFEQLSHRPPEQPRRLEPLRTCTRPLRVGLSKRAKTKHLHRPHPYR